MEFLVMKQSIKDLMVWKKAMNLVTEVYRLTDGFPKEEIYGLTNQMRRCAVSVPSNIAEGKGRHTNGEFKQFLIQARGSLLELETQIQISENLSFLKTEKSEDLKNSASEVGRMLNGLIESIREQDREMGKRGRG
jgi:four helix bundle protein